MKIISQSPVLDTSAYSAGDACGGLLTFDVGRGSGIDTTLLKRAELLDDDASPDSAALDLHLFADASLVGVDQATFAVSQANYLAGKYLGKISFASASYGATPVGTNAAATLCVVDDVNRLLPLWNGRVYGQLVATATPTFAASQLKVLLHFAEYA